ncbi:DUF814 family protein [Tieghemostelium lacteum]|uniref:DUF814 family protein n=1 Tax=Tieghemostelium lacteum TaxID=361077 RepID=A0A151Z336_TIELA|nr:DUF814 family protein [Tieghemostelium lacteum]|eukprot:KYQ88372.1 DUF814 family protein [Tieghemostelium lacteum]
MKTRFSSIDIRTTVSNLQKTLLGLRLANVYDLSPRVFLLKFSKPDCKKNLIIESGIRIHSTNFIRDKRDNTPAPFSLTLRKYLKTKRLESVSQLGVDRVVQFTFGSGVAIQHLFIELYSIGNIILTDGEYKILAILRTHQYNQDEAVAVGDVYPVDKAKKPVHFTDELIDDIVKSAQDKKESLKPLFNKTLDFGPELVEHCLLMAGLSPQTKVEQYDHLKFGPALIKSFKDAQSIYNVTVQSKGYIVLKDQKPEKIQKNKETGEDLVIYEEFVPYLYKQYQSRKVLEYESFDLAVDQFFSEIESQKIEQQRIVQEQNVLKKLDKVKEEHQKRIDSLLNQEELNIRKASLIELNLQEVDQCIAFIRYGVNAGMDWTMLGQMVKEEKKKNPYSVANKIKQLKLEQNKVTLLLSDQHLFDDEDLDEETQDGKKKKKKNEPLSIDVDISISALANAKTYYDTKKKSHQKAEKTIAQTEFALKAAEKKTRQQLAEVNLKVKSSMTQMRKVFWFEKFHWFISSDNYLVISGKDAQQNELLFKRYLEKDDLYVHADIFGSTSCVIKNPNGGEIPPNTLTQAGTMTMCYSNAWSAKVVTSAYWVYANQVSKTAPSGEYLTTGSFMIRGKKNYLPHSQLVMGFGFMFKIDESCIGNHINDRKPSQYALGLDDSQELDLPSKDDEKSGEKNLRKFERTKLKKEQKEMEEMEKQVESLNLPKDLGSSNDGSITTISTGTPQTNNDKFRVKLVTSYQEDLEDEKNESAENQQKDKPKAHLSAHQRKQLKKKGQQGDDDTDQQEVEEQPPQQQQTPKVNNEPKEKKSKAEPQKHLTPAQKNKLKKIKEKYGDQDEEERKERMEILGSAGNKKDKKKDKKNKNNQQQQNKGSKQQQQNNNNNNKNKPTSSTTTTTTTTTTTSLNEEKPTTPTAVTKEEKEEVVLDDIDSDSASDMSEGEEEEEEEEKIKAEEEGKTQEERELIQEKRRQLRKEKKEQMKKEQEEIKKILEEENSGMAVDPNLVNTNIDTLTGQPLENDILHFAIPVIAPYSVFNNYKFKVKLTPGHQKRGKAAKQAMQVLIQLQNITKIEKDLIKGIKDEDLAANMLSDVRIHAPNLLATKLQEKKEKKAKAIAKNKELTESKEQKE